MGILEYGIDHFGEEAWTRSNALLSDIADAPPPLQQLCSSVLNHNQRYAPPSDANVACIPGTRTIRALRTVFLQSQSGGPVLLPGETAHFDARGFLDRVTDAEGRLICKRRKIPGKGYAWIDGKGQALLGFGLGDTATSDLLTYAQVTKTRLAIVNEAARTL